MSLSARLLEIASRISQIPLSYYSTQLSSLIPKTSFSPHIHQISKLTILVLTITSIFYFTFISSHFSSSSYRTFALTTSGRKGTFLNSLSATDIDGPYDNSTLVELCRSRKWRKGLIFRCEAPSTGLVESRNVMLNCLRFGIEAGGTSPLYSRYLKQELTRVNSNQLYTTRIQSSRRHKSARRTSPFQPSLRFRPLHIHINSKLSTNQNNTPHQ